MDADLDLPLRPSRPRRYRRHLAIAAAGAILSAAALGAGIRSGSATTPTYRTATVAQRHVEQSLTGVATIEPVSEASVAFPAQGTVASVAVKVGDTVNPGTPLATLDPTSLEAALSEAKSTLAQAELTLERARNGESVAGTGTAGAQLVSLVTTGETETLALELVSTEVSEDEELRLAQQAVIDAQKQVDEDLAEADRALVSAEQICAALQGGSALQDGSVQDGSVQDGGVEPAEATGQDTPTTGAEAGDDSGSGSGSGSGDELAGVDACYQALTQVLQAQKQVGASQQALSAAATALDELLARRATAPITDQPTTTTPTTLPATTIPSATVGGVGQDPGGSQQPQSTTGSQQPQSTSSATAGGSSPSSQDLISYQRQVDAASAKVAVAEQALRQATITSPIAGKVIAVNVAAGDTVSAASTTATIVVQGDGGYEAVAMVKVTDLPDLEVGQAASVVPDGSGRAVTGTVAGIGLVSTSGTTGTTYPVTIALTGETGGLRNSAAGTVTITTAAADATLAVPTSAVRSDDGRSTVTVLDGGKASQVTVEVGAIGSAWTEIEDGLAMGQKVVLADLDEPLPGSATTSGQQQTPFGGGRINGFPPPS